MTSTTWLSHRPGDPPPPGMASVFGGTTSDQGPKDVVLPPDYPGGPPVVMHRGPSQVPSDQLAPRKIAKAAPPPMAAAPVEPSAPERPGAFRRAWQWVTGQNDDLPVAVAKIIGFGATAVAVTGGAVVGAVTGGLGAGAILGGAGIGLAVVAGAATCIYLASTALAYISYFRDGSAIG